MPRLLIILLAAMILLPHPGWARLERHDMAAMVTPPLQLGDKDPSLPIWTLLDGGGAFTGYIFESRDLAPLPGFSGTPINMLIAMDRNGTFLDVRLLEQNEPVFVSGLGPAPLLEFLRQYQGLSLGASIKVGGAHDQGRAASANTVIDGVSKATASVRITNETILASALAVAREKLAGIAPHPAGRPRPGGFRPMGWEELVASGLVGHLRLSQGEMEAAFAGTGLTEEGGGDGAPLDIWFADLGLPLVAGNLASPGMMERVRRHVEPWEEPILVLASGPVSITGENFVRNGVPDRLTLRQGSFPVPLRDADVEPELRAGPPGIGQALVLRVDTRLGFDPASPWSLGLRLTRRQPYMGGIAASRDFTTGHRPDPALFEMPRMEAPAPPWLASWTGRAWEIGVLLALLAALTLGLAGWRPWLAGPARLWPMRLAFLLVTLGFIGWYGQGQLSMVNLTGLIQSGGPAFLLYDPFTVILWLYTLASLAAWGRGTFCGWLCPFGALQELTGELGRLVRLPQWPVPPALRRIKYGVLAVVLGSVLVPGASDGVLEVEPFKTAITLSFQRAWPFALYAGGMLALGLVAYKGFCRVLCPLGAALALGGRIRRLDWIARRPQCGAPCRLCEVRCRYGAIGRDGRVDYAECFQCLDCVAIHEDPATCVPLVLAARRSVGPRA